MTTSLVPAATTVALPIERVGIYDAEGHLVEQVTCSSFAIMRSGTTAGMTLTEATETPLPRGGFIIPWPLPEGTTHGVALHAEDATADYVVVTKP